MLNSGLYMFNIRIRTAILLSILLFSLPAVPLTAQKADTEASVERPKVGVAFSGGAAKGLAHIGVLKVLEEVNMPVDYITGTSMGALIGGLYSIGYSPEFMTDLTLNLDWTELFGDDVERRYMPMEEKFWDGQFLITLPFSGGQLRLPRGLVSGQQISMLLSNLTWQYPGVQNYNDLPIPFACIATDLDSGEAHVMRNGVLSESIRASISLPSIFTPAKLEGKTLVDGGIVRNLPVSDAIEMGADLVIGINVTEGLKDADSLRSIIDIMDQTVRFRMYRSVSEEIELAHIMITPDVSRYNILDFDDALQIIDAGEFAAREMYDELKELADSLNSLSEREQRKIFNPESIDPVEIAEIRINGMEYYSEERLRSELMIEIGRSANPTMIAAAIDRLYSLQYFQNITYNLESAGEEGYYLNINVTEREQSTFSFGFRYDNYTSATLLFNNTFRNLVTAGSTLRLNARLGLEPGLDAQLIRYVGTGNQVGFQARINYLLRQFDIYNSSGERVFRFDNNSIYGELMFYPVSTSSIMIGGGIREEIFSNSSGIGFLDFDLRWSHLNFINGFIWFDTMDKAFFPSRGHSITARGLRSYTLGEGSQSFLKLELLWNSYYSMGTRLTLTQRGHAGYIYGDTVPVHHLLHMAGDQGFLGLQRYEISGSNMRWLQIGLRYEFLGSTYVHPMFNIGNTEDILNINPVDQTYQWGWGLSFGMETLLAPVQLTFMGGNRNRLLFLFSLGFTI
jgi:NTE family protein